MPSTSEQLGGFTLRETMPTQSRGVVRTFLRQVPVLEREAVGYFSQGRLDDMLQSLQDVPELPTPISKASSILYFLMDQYNDRASLAFRAKDTAHFAFWHDFAFGVSQVASGMSRADDAITGMDDENTIVGFSGAGEAIYRDDSPEDNSGKLAYDRKLQEMIQMLQEDPSGNKLADFIFQSVGSNMPNFMVPQYVETGAGLAVKLYKKIYARIKELNLEE